MQIVEKYLSAWNEREAGARRTAVEAAFAPGAVYKDPLMQGAGHAGLDAMIGAAQGQFPGHRFELSGKPASHNDMVRFAWTLGVPGAMFAEAGLSFLGLGVPPPTPSWGQMVGTYQGFVRTSPHLILYPSIVLAITMLAWIVLGDGVQEALDPNVRS